MAQVYVLRRMASGTKYSISGDFRRSHSLEHRSFMGRPDHMSQLSGSVSPGADRAGEEAGMSGERALLHAYAECRRI